MPRLCCACARIDRRRLDEPRPRRPTSATDSPYTVYQPLNAYEELGRPHYLGGNIGYGWGSVEQQPDQAVGLRRRRAGRLQFPERLTLGVRFRGRYPGHRRGSTGSRPGNSPTRGSARYAAAPAMRSTTCCSTATGGLAFGELRERNLRHNGEPHQRWLHRRRRRRKMGLRRTGAPRSSISTSISPTSNFTITGGVSNGYSFSLVRAGINYHFGEQEDV